MSDEINVSVREANLIKMSGGHKSKLSQSVNTKDPATARALDILCYNLAIFQDSKNELRNGTVIEGPSGLKPHPSINIMRNAADMVLRYMGLLNLCQGQTSELDEIDELLSKRYSPAKNDSEESN